MNQRGRREAASAWRVKAERSEAFTRQQSLQAAVTPATFFGEERPGRVEEGGEGVEGGGGEEKPAAMQPAVRGPKGRSWRSERRAKRAFHEPRRPAASGQVSDLF